MKFKLTKVDSLLRKRLFIIKKTFPFLLCTIFFSFTTENAFSQEKVNIENDRVVPVDEVFAIIQKQNNRKGRVACSTINSRGIEPSVNDNTTGISTTANTKSIIAIFKNNKSYTSCFWIKISTLTLLRTSQISNQSNDLNSFKFSSWKSLVLLITNTLKQNFLEQSARDISESHLVGQIINPYTKSKFRSNVTDNYYMVDVSTS